MNINKQLIQFLNKSSSNYHAVQLMVEELKSSGFKELKNNETWNLDQGDKYFVTVNGTALIAFDLSGYSQEAGFKIVASHTDAPNFKIKPNATKIKNGYITLNTEAYGGLINYSWYDRPLKLAGRVVAKENGKLKVKLFDSIKPVGVIPSLAIHMNRKVNDETKFNRHEHMAPVIGQGEDFDFKDYLTKQLDIKPGCILDYDLYLKPVEKATLVGLNDEFITSNHLDNLQCAYMSLLSFKDAKSKGGVNVYVSFDNEEVGSMTKQGAQATILKDVLNRISMIKGRSEEEHLVALSKSFIVSADNAHANHPNYAKFNDENHLVTLNGGVVIKYSANQKYTTDALSSSVMMDLAHSAKVEVQSFTNRSDSPGGSTLGAISGSQVSIMSVDIGLPQFAMHSSNEMSGSSDTEAMYKLLLNFYNKELIIESDSITIK